MKFSRLQKGSYIMSLVTLTTRDLARVQKLVEQKESLAEQIVDIDRQLEAIESGAPVSEVTARPNVTPPVNGASPVRKPRKAGKSGRGALKERISKELQGAGAQGLKVRELADRLGTSYANVTAFFHSTAKKMRGVIKKVGPARFAWKS